MAIGEKIVQAEQGGGPDRIATQHSKGKLTARERLSLLFDSQNSNNNDNNKNAIENYDEVGKLHGSNGEGVVTAIGKIWGRPVCAFSQDFTFMGGSLGKVHAEKVVKLMGMAAEMQCPIVGLNDSGGARIQEGVDALAGYRQYLHFVCVYF